jgi:tripartite-type tricarboxylate transporter receptor subunit TctC
MQKSPQIDPLKDFTYIINLTGYTFGLVVPAGAPWKTLKDYVDDAKKNPGKIDYGSTGTGTTPHLAMEEFSQKAGIKLTHVPYKGSADLMAAILGGHLMSVSDSTGFAPQVEAGKLRILATFGSKRTKRWPDVPTLNELGYDTISDSPFGIAGPAGMETATVKTLHDALKRSTTRKCSACWNATTNRSSPGPRYKSRIRPSRVKATIDRLACAECGVPFTDALCASHVHSDRF